jgi:hypothetical protein
MAKPSGFARLKEAEAPPQQIAAPMAPTSKPSVQANRIGMKTVIFYDVPEAVRELKRLGVDQDRTVQDLMREALDDLLVKYGKHAFGERSR